MPALMVIHELTGRRAGPATCSRPAQPQGLAGVLVLQVQREDVVRPGMDQPKSTQAFAGGRKVGIRNPLTAKKLALSGA